MTFGRGFLRKPAVKQLLDRWRAEEDEAQRIKERNDEIFTRAVNEWFQRTDSGQMWAQPERKDGQ